MKKKLKVLELFAGTRSIGKAFEARGHDVYSIEWDEQHPDIDWYVDISKVTAQDILERFGRPDVIWASPDCFTKGHIVTTKEGYKPIEEVCVGDEVLTHKNRFRKVYNTMSKTSDHIHKIKIAGAEEFEVTEEHPFLARKKSKKWNNERRSYDMILGEAEWVKAKDLTNEYRVQKLVKREEGIPNWDGVQYVLKNQFGKYDGEIVNELSALMDNPEFWWMMGRFLGDGTVTYNEKSSKYQFEICCNKNNGDTKIIKEVLDKLPFNYSFSVKNTTNVFAICKKELALFATLFGKGAAGKYIPDFALNLPLNLSKNLVDGYLSADGSRYVNKKGHVHLSVTTVSEKLAYSFSVLLTKVYGAHPSLVTFPPKENHIIEGRVVKCKKQYVLSWYEGSEGFTTKDDNSVWVNVRKNERIEGDFEVFNISVEEDETYVVRNITVHNCTSYSIAGISHHRRKNVETGNLDPVSDYAKFSDELNIHMYKLIEELKPTYYFVENPRGGMRKMTFLQHVPHRDTITYCQYSDFRMKPTDIFHNHPDPQFKPPCKNGAPCHVAAPRGSATGTQGIKGTVDRSRIPGEFCDHIAKISELTYDQVEVQEEIKDEALV